MAVCIELFPFLSDNYCILVHDEATGATASVDAIDPEPILTVLARRKWVLTDIFVTHHHWDHTDGIMPLKNMFDIRVTGPAAEADKIDGLDVLVNAGDEILLGETTFEMINTPGHTLGHISYFDHKNKNLFCGDALFSLGCGRMFEGAPAPMWAGLQSLRQLPDDTNVYCGHEYSAANAKFALSIDPDNPQLQSRVEQISKLAKSGQPTIPFNLGEDKRANPFLQADSPRIAKNLKMSAKDPSLVFGALRKAKDTF